MSPQTALEPSAPESAAAPTTPEPIAAANRKAQILEGLAGRYRLIPVLAVLVAICIFFTSQTDVFLSSRNLTNLAMQITVTATLALGLVFVLLLAEIDLSVGQLSAVCAAVCAALTVNEGVSAPIAILLALVAGAAAGSVQGWISTRFAVPSFLVTLAGSLVLQGVLLTLLPPDIPQIALSGTSIADISSTFLAPGEAYTLLLIGLAVFAALRFQSYLLIRREGRKTNALRSVVLPPVAGLVFGTVLINVLERDRGVPLMLVILLALLTLCSYLTTQTKFGTYVFAIGGNAEAARRAGIPVTRVRVAAFAITGTLAAVGGILAASRVLAVSNASNDSTLLLESIAAAVIGGASLFGGRGTVWAALIGALVIGSIANGLLLLDASTRVRLMVQGGILLLAVLLDSLISRAGREGR